MNGYRNERMPARPPSDQDNMWDGGCLQNSQKSSLVEEDRGTGQQQQTIRFLLMADLHIYLVPPEIWRDKFNNALNARIDDTISLGFIRVHPQTKVQALRDEIEQQLGGVDLPIPREYVFLKSVGRSLTRLKSRQEAQLKVKNFLPPNAYAPELYLLEATPAVLAMSSSEGSTRPPTQTSFDAYEPFVPQPTTNGMPNAGLRQSDEQSLQHVKYNEGTSLPQAYSQLPQITSRPQYPTDSSAQHQYPHSNVYPKKSPTSGRHSPPVPGNTGDNSKPSNFNSLSVNWENADSEPPGNRPTKNQNHPYTTKTPNDLRLKLQNDSHDPTHLDRPPASSTRRAPHETHQEEYRPPLSATPPASPGTRQNRGQNWDSNRGQNRDSNRGQNRDSNRGENRGDNRDENREQKSHHHANDASGITGLTPDETYHGNHSDVLDRRKQEVQVNGEPPRSQSPEKHEDPERSQNQAWATDRLTDRDRQNYEALDRRRNQENDQQQLERNQEGIDDDAQQTKNDSDEELTQYPSPPPLQLSSPSRDTESAKEERRKQKDLLSKELEEVRVVRREAERQREDLVKQAKHMQNNMQNKRNHARDIWKKRYFDEKRKTGPFEEQCNRLRHELDIIHKKLLSTLEGPKEKATKLANFKPPSHKNNFKIQATRLQHDIEDVRQRVEYAKMKLTGEMKLRNQAETELRALRAELTQKKINLTLSRNSQLTAYAPPASEVKLYPTVSTRHGITPRS